MKHTAAIFFIFWSVIANADVHVPCLFGDSMILQQETSNAVWGWADAGETVTVEASWGETASIKTGEDGRWKVFLKTPPHDGTKHSLTISGKNTIEISDVAIGEVWICAGQSNMGWSTGNSFEAGGESEVNLPNFRIFRSEREHWHEPLEENRDRLAKWKACDPASAAETSAVAYYFGKTLHRNLDVPVGIIQRAFAGTPIEGWMPWELQKEDSRAIDHKRTMDENASRQKNNRGQTTEKALADFETELAEYNRLIDAGETMKNSFKQLAPPIITQPADLGHQYPQHIYNAMIKPVAPYGIRGMIWYQGERNSKNAPQAAHYQVQLGQLIKHYRTLWNRESKGNVSANFPFQFTQLPSWNAAQSQPVEGIEAPWAVNRESMRRVEKEVVNTGMAVAIDTGDAVELHPKNKKPIGIRHALLALENVYGKKIVGSGPRYRNHVVEGNEIVLTFDSVGSGLKSAREEALNSFAIAGGDQVWHWAEAKIEGEKIKVSSPDVNEPIAVRYAWAMNPSDRNLLYNQEGLPASPFRTDDWPLFDPAADLVEVNKPAKPNGYVAVDWVRPQMSGVPNSEEQKAGNEPADGLAPEVVDLNAEDVSFALEAKLPDLEQPFIDTDPDDLEDGIPVVRLTRQNSDRRAILNFAREITKGDHGEVDSFLLMKDGELIFESYYRRGRINYPHYQMSITKSYTAMAVGRAIQLGHLKMDDLDKPVISFLKDVDPGSLVDGADKITLAEAMNMRSGIRLKDLVVKQIRKSPEKLKGQGQVEMILANSNPIPAVPREFKYQGADPSMTMQIIEATVPGSARDFLKTEVLGRMGIENYAWQDDISGLPKSAAGSSMRSRDMIKWGMLMMNSGKWQGEQIVPEEFVKRATSRLHTNQQGTSYGFFWWRHDMKVGDQKIDCISGRGAGGQFILMFPELDLIAVITSHNKGMGSMLKTFPEKILPGFLSSGR